MAEGAAVAASRGRDWDRFGGRGKDEGRGRDGRGRDGATPSALRPGRPTKEEAGAPHLNRVGEGEKDVARPKLSPVLLLRAGEGAIVGQGMSLVRRCVREGWASLWVTARSTTMEASHRFMNVAGPREVVGVGGIGHLLGDWLPQKAPILSIMS